MAEQWAGYPRNQRQRDFPVLHTGSLPAQPHALDFGDDFTGVKLSHGKFIIHSNLMLRLGMHETRLTFSLMSSWHAA
jgi:hypothetical protein